MPTIDIDRDAAHEAAQQELGKPIYPKPSLTERFTEWLNEVLYRIVAEGSTIPGGWFTISVLLILLAVAIVVAVRIARRTMRTDRGKYALFAGQELSAAEHRATAEQYAAVGDWTVAIRHRLRAVARQLEETGVLHAVPGRTATELATDAGQAFPRLSGELGEAAITFNDVTYGERPGTESAYRLIADLDDHLRYQTSASVAAGGTSPSTDGWAEVR